MGMVPATSRDGRLAALLCGALHAAVAGAGVLLGLTGTSDWSDEAYHHLPVIETFAAQFPTPVLSDYLSATTPGYHLFLAAFLWMGFGEGALHLVNVLIGAAVVAIFAYGVGKRAGLATGALVGSVLALSPYMLSGSVWLMTDNAGLLFVVLAAEATLRLLERSPDRPTRGWFGVALVALAGACVRQIVVFASGFVGALMVSSAVAERRLPTAREIAESVLALVPSVLLVAFLLWLWGGLVPPAYLDYHGSGGNPVTPVYALAVVGFWGFPIFFAVPGFWRALLERASLTVAACALPLLFLVDSSFVKHVRWGGVIWTASKFFPTVADRSSLVVGLALVGVLSVAAMLRVAWRSPSTAVRAGTLCCALMFLGSVVAQMANQQCFERYLQPFAIVVCGLAAGIVGGRGLVRWPIALAAFAALAASAQNVFRAGL
jgi:hypothetical protein